jgi:hypothetical protein
LQKGTQRARQQLRSFRAQSARLALNKPDDVARTQARQLDRSIAETVFEEAPDKRDIVEDGGRCQDSFFAQVLFVFLRASRNSSRPRSSHFLARNDALASQELN